MQFQSFLRNSFYWSHSACMCVSENSLSCWLELLAGSTHSGGCDRGRGCADGSKRREEKNRGRGGGEGGEDN